MGRAKKAATQPAPSLSPSKPQVRMAKKSSSPLTRSSPTMPTPAPNSPSRESKGTTSPAARSKPPTSSPKRGSVSPSMATMSTGPTQPWARLGEPTSTGQRSKKTSSRSPRCSSNLNEKLPPVSSKKSKKRSPPNRATLPSAMATSTGPAPAAGTNSVPSTVKGRSGRQSSKVKKRSK